MQTISDKQAIDANQLGDSKKHNLQLLAIVKFY